MKSKLTNGGYEKLLEEMKDLTTNQRPTTVIELDIAREQGDLKENAEYHAAKEQLAFIDYKLRELGAYMNSVEIMDPSSYEHDVVKFGSTLSILDLDTDKELVYTIVGSYESLPNEGKISVDTPIAKAFLRKSPGDEVIVHLPGGEKEYEILKVWYKEC